ncbi:MAG TPA: energy-coupling factor transporter ATPase [Bacillota bacterium]|nr:energy-coupling factor transporter ATPase [Bacillota bacterium]HQC35653.1 energy-coupling factor transporter ATPase [Bacillota bacterium]
MRIEVKDLCHVYSPGLPYETVALDGISFCCEPGEFVGLIGRTGSGKSTLLQHINGLLKPSSGTVLADGVDINEKSEEARALRRRIGLVFQYPEYQLFEESVIKDVCFGPKNQGLSEEDCKARAEKALRLVGLDPDEKGQASPFTLSGGEKRRAAIAGVLAMEPEVLILDEPTAGLDPKGRRDILMMIENVRKTQNITILLVSHSMDDVAALAERVLVIEKGRVLMNASTEEVFARGGELRAIGLSRPSASRLLDMLADRGLTVDRSIISKEEAEEEIMRVFKKWP